MKIAIIGAGFSGCNLYNNLKDKYENITIFEKSRGVGGRISTKYIDDKFIDHGTSTLIPITDDLKFFCLDLVKNGVLKAKYDEFIPKNGFTLASFKAVLTNEQAPVVKWVFNSLVVSGLHVLCVLFIGSLAAFGYGRLKFKGKETLLAILLGSMMIPGIANLIPAFKIIDSLG